ncbi:MAG: tetratricopeptide repeat protein [Bdellovibrionaceae bacterium]|nr:tetratricopeptide repeat protein [Pseudobdellovibrionaceae bacterium]
MNSWAKGLVVFCMTIIIGKSVVYAQEINCNVSRMAEVSHVECSGRQNWKYEVKRVNTKTVKMNLPYLDQLSRTKLLTWSDRFIQKIEISRDTKSRTDTLTIHFNQNNISLFDYLTDDPSRLIVDYYVDQDKDKAIKEQEKLVLNKIKKAQKQKSITNLPKSYNQKSYKKLESKAARAPAGNEVLNANPDPREEPVQTKTEKINSDNGYMLGGSFDGGDPHFNRFKIKSYEINEESIIASKQNIYIRFPMLKMSVNKLKSLLKYPPEYAIKAKSTKENKEARLLLELFKRGRYAVFLKTYEYYTKTYKDSEYKEIVHYMAADVHFNLWLSTKHNYHYETATKLYQAILKDFPSSVLAQRTEMLLSYAALERKDTLNIIQYFQNFIEKYPNSKKRDQAKFAIAEGYLMLNKEEEALKIYEDIITSYQDEKSKIEAIYRKGDVYFQQRKFDKSIEFYELALKTYPKFKTIFPNANYNLAESYFWKGKFQDSLANYIHYLNYFPRHDHNAYAMTRVGEVLEILGVNDDKIKGAYLESYFRFQKHQGGKISRIRLLSTQMEGMGEKELTQSLEELERYKEEINLPKIKEFITLMITDGFRRRKEYDKSINYLVSYYQKNPTSTNLNFFRTKIVNNIADSLNEKVNDKHFVDVLKVFGKYSTTWLRKVERYDVNFFLGRSYELAGVFTDSEKIYTETLRKIKKIEGTKEGLERKVNEHLPTQEELYLRLANVNFHLRNYAKAYNSIKKIKNKAKLTEELRIELVTVAAKIYKAQGQNKMAIEYMKKSIKQWDGDKKLLMPAYLELAELYLANKDYLLSEITASKIIDNNKQEIDPQIIEKALITKGDALFKQRKSISSVEVYSELLEKFEKKRPMDRYRYKVGKILFDRGDVRGAEKLWAKLGQDSSNYYQSLANEKIEHKKWQNNYKKYINRIPAMSKTKQR